MRLLQLAFWSLTITCLTGVFAEDDAQVPICHKCEENKKPIPKCSKDGKRHKPPSGQCVVTYSCSGHCGTITIPHVDTKSMECDYAEVTVGPDGKIIDQCCDPPECPGGCDNNNTKDVCVNDQYGCPAIDGTIQKFGGKYYRYRCNSAFCATTVSSVSTTDTLKECAEKCSKDPACKMVSHHDKKCVVATKVGSVEKLPGSVVLEPIDNPGPGPDKHGDCAKLDKTRHTVHGMEFLLHCDTRLTDPKTCKQHPASSFEECANLCATESTCASASFSAGHCCLSDGKPSLVKEPGSIGLEPLPGYGCPYVDWAVKEIGGVKYEYHCDAWLTSGGKWTLVQVANEMECALQCSKNTHCTGISLRGQQCYIATAAISLQPKGDWVALVPVSKKKPTDNENGDKDKDKLDLPECRAAHGHEVTYKGHTYQVDCYRWVGGDGFKTATMHKLADCVKMCAEHSNCVALHYLPAQQFCAIHDNIPRVGTQGDFGVAYVKRIR